MYSKAIPSTTDLIVSGGDTRIIPDPISGLTIYGCRAEPDPEVIALGSSTASSISVQGMAAAEALHQICVEQMQQNAASDVYRMQMQRIRDALLVNCGFAASDGVNAVFAASGTDLHFLLAQWLQPQRIVMINSGETGSGVLAALKAQHFNRLSAHGGAVALGEKTGNFQSEVFMITARNFDGSLRAPDAIHDEYTALVKRAVEAGQTVLLLLTDVSKTGLIFPDLETALELKKTWPDQVEVLVDACQFRLSAQTIRAYLAHDCILALTGSKFLSGPTFSGALLIPSKTAKRFQDKALPSCAYDYTAAAEWPSSWQVAQSLPSSTNFGLLLRWEAALTELQSLRTISDEDISIFLRQFGNALRDQFMRDAHFELLPSTPLNRLALTQEVYWDNEPTIFPFLVYTSDDMASRRLLRIEETKLLYEKLRQPKDGSMYPQFQLGQPVIFGERDGRQVSALRICVSAPMIVSACRDNQANLIIGQAIAALQRIRQILNTDLILK